MFSCLSFETLSRYVIRLDFWFVRILIEKISSDLGLGLEFLNMKYYKTLLLVCLFLKQQLLSNLGAKSCKIPNLSDFAHRSL